MRDQTGNSYRQRLTKVIDYMYQHIGDDLDVNTLADVACMSPYHFHRIYRQLAQETVNKTVRRLRLHKAAADLIRTELPLAEIAKSLRYGSLEAFSRAFTKEFGETPSHYRTTRSLNNSEISLEPFIAMLPLTQSTKAESVTYPVEIREMDSLSLVGFKHQGDYMDIGKSFEKLFVYASTHGLMGKNTRSVGLYYDDPQTVDAEKLRSVACISNNKNQTIDPHSGLQEYMIPAGKVVSVVFKGPYAELDKAYNWLFGEWIPESEHELVDFPPFEEYLNDPKTTPPNELLTSINCLIY